MKQFVHLHTHTDASLLDGFGTAKETVETAARLGQPAIAFTDHGKLTGLYNGYNAAKAAGIKFIAGIEAYFTPSSTTHDAAEAVFFGDGGREDVSGKGAYTHLTILAETNEGLANLFKMNMLASTEGFFRKPRMSLQMLADHADGLIVTTGCPSGEIQTRLRLGQFDQALGFASQLVDIVGKGNVYVELMDHNMSIGLERDVREGLMEIAELLGLPLVATNDVHYALKEDCHAHEEMLAIQTGSVMSELPDHEGGKRFAFEGSEYYVKSAEDMLRLFPEDSFPGAVSNTLAIAERCNVQIESRTDLRPHFPLPEGFTVDSEYLEHLAYKGLAERLPHKAQDPKYLQQMKIELSIIIPKDYSNYFLVVSDFTRWARTQGIAVGPGRGSAGGSLLAFCLYITDIDPLKHDLLFERFLNPERDSPPDIDMDFDDRSRERVYEYVVNKYGYDHVSQVITFGGMKGKNSLKDEARIYELPYATSNELTKAYPPAIFGKDMPLRDVYDHNSKRYEEADGFRKKVEELGATKIAESALKLEGRTRSTGVHACAVLISGKPLTTTVPLEMRQTDKTIVAQWEYPSCENIGLLKMDFLGLRNLGIVQDCVALVKKYRGIEIDLDGIKQGDMDDPATFRMLAAGNTLGVFQLDGGPMRDLLKLMRPNTFDDISAVLALYRPGPMGVNAHIDYALRKNGLQEAAAIHPEFAEPLKEILAPTHNLIVYQEQVMQIAQKVSSYTLAQADNLRRAMGKKKREVLDAEYVPFRDGALGNGFSDDAIETLWSVLVPFADYSFNKSHTVGYGYMSYLTAYLKANYTAEFFSALLSSVTDSTEKTALYLEDAKHNGIKVLPPDINNSTRDYSPLSSKEVLFGLKAIKGVSDHVSNLIVEERNKNGKFVDFSDVMNRLPNTIVNKRVFEAFGYSGAFDAMGYTRKSVVDSLEYILKDFQKANRVKAKNASMGGSLFDGFDFEEELKPTYELLPAEEYPNMLKLQHERSMLGLYVSGHPLDGLNFGSINATRIAEILAENVAVVEGFPRRGQEPIITIAGIASSYAARPTKKGSMFGAGALEDRTGQVEFVMFSKTFEDYSSFMKVDGIYALTGYPQRRGEGYSFVVNSVRPLEFSSSGSMPVRIKVTRDQWDKGYHDLLLRLQVHAALEGKGTDVVVSVRNFDGSAEEETLPIQVKPSTLLLSEIRELFGVACIGRWRSRPQVQTES